MRHLLLLGFLILGVPACAGINDAAFAPAPIASAPSVMWAAPGVRVVGGWEQPMYLVDDTYWLWNDATWMAWRGIGWQRAQPPLALVNMRGGLGFGDQGWAGGALGQVVSHDHRRTGTRWDIARDAVAPVGHPNAIVHPTRGGPAWGGARVPGGGFRGATLREHRR